MMTATDWTDRLKYLATQRKTYYDNHFPGNCGEINSDGSISFDCIGLVKSVINEPGIAYKYSPAGYYVTPGQVIPDYDEIGILNLGTDITWWDFSNVANGEYLYMPGHGGVYFSGNSDVNVAECTGAWRGGVLCSWVDPDGTRRDCRGGSPNGRWSAHSKLSKYIDYTIKDGLVRHNDGTWWFYRNGKIDYSCNSVVKNEYGWWKVVNGKVDFTYNGLAKNENGWWMLQGGKVDFDFNGLACNEYGFWVLDKGKVNFNYNGNYKFSGCTYKIKGGKVEP